MCQIGSLCLHHEDSDVTLPNVKTNPIGPTGQTVATNVAYLQRRDGPTFRKTEVRLTELGRPISKTGLARLTAGDRRIDVDDLVTLSSLFGVSPVTLLMPVTESPDILVATSALPSLMPARQYWAWLRGGGPIPGETRPGLARYQATHPAWEQEALSHVLDRADSPMAQQLGDLLDDLANQAKED